jgi:hypothetical protein
MHAFVGMLTLGVAMVTPLYAARLVLAGIVTLFAIRREPPAA